MSDELYSPWCFNRSLRGEQDECSRQRKKCRKNGCSFNCDRGRDWGNDIDSDTDNSSNQNRRRCPNDEDSEDIINLGTNLKIVQDGEANGGDGGNARGGDGGDGGDGGVVTNVATAVIDNVVVIVTDNEIETDLALGLGLNNKQLDLKVDDKGSVFINGKKMNETQLDNGTKVFVLRDEVTKSTTAE